MDTSNIRVSNTNLIGSISTTLQNLDTQTMRKIPIVDTNVRISHTQLLQVMSRLYSDMLDLVLESNDLAKVFHIKAKLEAMDYSETQADKDYKYVLRVLLNSLNTNLN